MEVNWLDVLGMKVETTDHFDDRLEERDINLDDIKHLLKDKINKAKPYNDSEKELCCRLNDLSIFFEVRNDKVVLITALDKYANYVTDAVVI